MNTPKPGTLNDKTILVVNTGSSKKRFTLQKLKKLGLKILVLNKEKNWAQPYVDHWILADTNDHQESISALSRFLRENPSIKLEGALTFWEDDVLLTSRITDKFNLIGIPYSIAKNVRNKYKFREFCKANNVRTPRHALIQNKKDIERIKNEFDFPIVIKPVYGSSSAFVVKVEESDEIEVVYNYVKSNLTLQTESALHDGFDVLAEEYIEGDEVDIDIIIQNGKIKFHSITDNYKTVEPFFVETGESIPSVLSEKRQEELFELAEETLEKLGIQNGCIHFEAKSSKDEAVPIEINLRMGGDEVYSIVKGVWGVDLVENAARVALGSYIKKIKCPEQSKKFIMGQYFLSDYSGILSKLDINEKIKKKKYIEDMQLFKKIGEAILVPPEGFEYLGWITVSGRTLMDARNNMNEVLEYVNFDVSKFHPSSSIGKVTRKNQFSVASVNKNMLLGKARIEKIKKVSFKNQRNLSIGIACDKFSEIETENSILIEDIKQTLNKQGYKTFCFDLNDISKAISFIQKNNIDLIFNTCETIDDVSLLEPHVAAVFDIMQIPYTGSNPYTLSLCIDKIRVKKLLAYHGIPTPKWDYIYSMEDELVSNLKYPLIVKPSNTDNSFGITNESVVTNPKELKRQLKVITEKYKRPALIEEFIDGDEFDVCLIGNDEDVQVLPLIRSVFDKMPKGYWHIYSFELKSGKNKKVMDTIKLEKPAKIDKKLDKLISEIAMDVYNILDCHDYGKVEIRVDRNGNPYVLELNPNPPIDKDDFLSEAAKLAGYKYDELLEEIINLAIERYKNKPPFHHLQY
jgi:D-alanine-D-alanine ligase